MDIRLCTSSEDFRTYDVWLRTHPDGSLWQSLEWKAYQESLGRTVKIYAATDDAGIQASALVVIDRTTFGLCTWEIPRGPLGSGSLDALGRKVESEKLIERIHEDAKKDCCFSLYFSPSKESLFTSCPACPSEARWRRRESSRRVNFPLSTRLVHPETTRIVDLRLSEEDLLSQMKPKGRYNITLAERHGVCVMPSSDIQAYAHLAGQTARRGGFKGHSQAFYEGFLHHLPGAFLLLAYPLEPPVTPSSSAPSEEGAGRIAVAGLLGVIWGTAGSPTEAGAAAPAKVGIYYYGASSDRNRELMAPYLLQWEAMKYCKAMGCISYDLFGIAPDGQPDHPWAGVSAFKAKFGGNVMTYPPEQEITLRPMMKKLLQWKRAFLG